jgi:hypothetical protein
MKNRISFIAALAAVSLASMAALADSARRPMALIIMWDGFRADGIVNADLPNVRKLAFGEWQSGYAGAWSFAGKPLPDARAYSFANHASILNGVTATKHGVWFNHTSHKCRVKEWPSFFTRILDAKPKTKAAFLYACGHYDWDLCQDDRVYNKTYGLAVQKECDDLAALYSSPDAPDVAALFMEFPDAQGHAKGYYPMSAEYRGAIVTNDCAIGKVLSAIAARPTFKDEDWLVMLTTDHGGYHRMHGWRDTHSHTIPVILAGRRVVNGPMAGFPCNYDLSVTVLEHFGVSTEGLHLDGRVVGKEPSPWGPAARIDESLAWYFPLKEKGKYLVNAVPGGAGIDPAGDEEYFNPNRPSGLFGGHCLYVGGDEDVVCAESLSGSEGMFMALRPSFTISFWARMTRLEGDPVVMGNKTLARSGSPGFAVVQGRHTERTSNGVCLVYGTPEGGDVLVGTMDIEVNEWSFYAVVFTPDGQAWFYQGRKDGSFHWICGDARRALLASGLPLFIGQDGTGTWKWNYKGYLDDIAVWRRPLAISELRAVFAAGRSGKRVADVAGMSVPNSAPRDYIDTTLKASR